MQTACVRELTGGFVGPCLQKRQTAAMCDGSKLNQTVNPQITGGDNEGPLPNGSL